MPRTRLVVVMMLVSFCAGQALAQSQRNNTSSAVAPQDKPSASLSDSAAADQFQVGSYPQIDFDGQNGPKDDPIKERSGSRKDLMKLLDTEQNRPHVVRGMELHSDVTCYSIRSYLVVRDDPHSDTTHRDGYSTCVPAARVRMYSAIDHGR